MLPQLYRHRWMDEEIEAFREQVRRYIAGEMVPHLDGWRRQGYIPREVWRPFGEMGFLLPEVDEAYEGAGASLAYQLVVQDELAKAEFHGQHRGALDRRALHPRLRQRGAEAALAAAGW